MKDLAIPMTWISKDNSDFMQRRISRVSHIVKQYFVTGHISSIVIILILVNS